MQDLILIMLCAAVVAVGTVAIIDCSNPITVALDGVVVKKTMELNVSDELRMSYAYTVWVEAQGKIYKFDVDKKTYFSVEVGTPVKVGIATGRYWGLPCTSPVLIVP